MDIKIRRAATLTCACRFPTAPNFSVAPLDRDVMRLPLYRWGARSAQYFNSDDFGGYAAKFPETCCAALADIRAGKWTAYAPRPVRIVASRVIQLDRMIGPVHFALSPANSYRVCSPQSGVTCACMW